MTSTAMEPNAEAKAIGVDAVYATSVPGLVLWRFPRRVLRRRNGEKVRSASYSLTHEPSGHALLPGMEGRAKHALRLAEGLDLAAKLGDLRQGRRPVDWTQDIETLRDNRVAHTALLVLAGFRLIFDRYPPAVTAWAERNDIDLVLEPPKMDDKVERFAESATRDTCDPRHPHEPEILPILDGEGRCLVCVALVKAHEEGFDAGLDAHRREALWLLTGDLDWLEYAIADYVWRWGQHLPGVHPETTGGVPVAVANMAMTVIRKNVRRIDLARFDGSPSDG